MGRPREFDVDTALDKALEVFWHRGYAAAPIQEICGAMGLNPGSVYAAFGSKHGLFLKVVQRYLDQMNRPGVALMEAEPDGLKGVRAYFDFIVEGIVTGNRRWGCLGTNAFLELKENDPDVARLMSEHLTRLEQAFCRALERADARNAAESAKYLLCVSQGLNVIAKTGPDRPTLQKIVETALLPLAKEGEVSSLTADYLQSGPWKTATFVTRPGRSH
jgi:TetR/AcrR family transcriptional repressor of nem operon